MKRVLIYLGLPFLVALLIAATVVVPGRKIRDYQRVTALDDTDVFIIDDVVNNTNQSIEWQNIKSVTNGFAGTNYVNTLVTTTSNGLVTLITATSNGLVTFTTNLVTVTSNGLVDLINSGDRVWTNDAGLIHPRELSGQKTNSIQIYTNGGLSIGPSTRAYWGIQPGSGGETMISARNTTNGESDWNEISIITTDGTNAVFQDYFLHASLNRSWFTMNSPTTGKTEIDTYIDDDSDIMFRAWDGTNGGYRWRFQPGIALAGDSSYLFNSYDAISTNSQIVVFQNAGTNKVTINGLGYIGINTNDASYPLHIFATDITKPAIELSYLTGAGNTAAFQIRNGTGVTNASLDVAGNAFLTGANVSGTITGNVGTVTSLNVLGGTLGAGKVLTDTGGTGAATWQTVIGSLTGTTNYINLSVQAAKLPGNDNPAIGSGYKNWELVYYKTNAAGSIAALSANWQFVVPPDYATNSLQLYMQQMILQTNGPATSNTIFCASVFKSTPGDSVDIHTNVLFNSEVCVTNTWSASTSGTNILQTSLFSFGANAPVQSGDFVVLTLKRDGTNDTYGWEASVAGMQLLYTRK